MNAVLSASDTQFVPVLNSALSSLQNVSEGNLAQAYADVQGARDDINAFRDAGLSAAAWLDPLSILINNGLGFLLDLPGFSLLKDGIELVTGDAGSMEGGADQWASIATSLQTLSDDVVSATSEGLSGWSGAGASAAGREFAELGDAINGMSSEASQIQELLVQSGILMTAAYDIVISIISDLISWLIMTWVAAHASAIITVGASEVAAMSATVAEVGITVGRVTGKVAQVQRIVTKIQQILSKLRTMMVTFGTTLRAFSQTHRTFDLAGSAANAARGAAEGALNSEIDHGVHRGIDAATGNGPEAPVSEGDIDDGLTIGR